MKIVLTDDVVGVGDVGEAIQVRPGFARNYLIPRGLAFEAGSASAKSLGHKMRQVESKKKKLKDVAEQRATSLQGLSVTLELRAGEGGRTFGSISARDIAAKLVEKGYELDRRRVLLTDAIKKLGEHDVVVKLHQDVETTIKVIVVPREMSKEELEAEVGKVRRNVEEAVAAE